MIFPVLFLLVGFAETGSGKVACINNSHCKDVVCEEGRCANGCEDGYYGRYCTNLCSPGCKDRKCADQGNCIGDCVDGKWGITCGLDCLDKCKSCNKTSGPLCTSCKEYEFGSHCSETCRETCSRTGCDMNGICVQTCTEKFSKDCIKSCGVGCKTCNEITGSCDKCLEDFRGEDCEVYCINCLGNCTKDGCEKCKQGHFGKQCESRCNENCENDVCSRLSGNCSDGCRREYHGSKCGSRCNEHCKDGVCDRTTGECMIGCTDGHYGAHCRIYCDNCLDEKCHSQSGECTISCKKGFFGKKCTEECGSNCSSGYCTRFDGACYTPVTRTTTDTALPIYYIAGGSAGCLIVVIIVCLLIFRWRKIVCFTAPTSTITKHGSVRKHRSLPPVPHQAEMTHDYSSIDECGSVPSYVGVQLEQIGHENEQLLNNSSLPRLQVNRCDLDVFEMQDLNLQEHFNGNTYAGGEAVCHQNDVPNSDEQSPTTKDQIYTHDVSRKYLSPVDGDICMSRKMRL